MDTVFIVRDFEERYIQGVYRHRLDALDSIERHVEEVVGLEEEEEYRQSYRDNFEIIEMPLE